MKIFGLSILALGTVKSNGNKKIYITNKNLEKSLPVGTKVITKYNKEAREIVLTKAYDKSSNHTISSKSNGTPVLDLKNKLVVETIGNVDKIEAIFYEDRVVIKVPKTIIQAEERKAKNGKSIFEIFSGASTLTNMFESEGFVSRGCLELCEKNMAVYHENHKDKDVYTVCANIEDIDIETFPKDVDVCLVTPVCTDASISNMILNTAIKNKKNGLDYDTDVIERMERSDALMYYALRVLEHMNPTTIVFENVEGWTKNSYDSSLERGIYTLTKTILKSKGYKITEHIGESHNTTRKRWTMVCNMDEEILLNDIIVDQSLSIVAEHLAVQDSEREWKEASEFAPSRLTNNTIGIRAVELNDYRTPTFSTHHTRRTFPILHKVVNRVDLYSHFTPEDIKNIHGLSKDFILPKEKTVAYRVLGQGVASMFKEVAKTIAKYYDAKGSVVKSVKELIEVKTVVQVPYKQLSLFDVA